MRNAHRAAATALPRPGRSAPLVAIVLAALLLAGCTTGGGAGGAGRAAGPAAGSASDRSAGIAGRAKAKARGFAGSVIIVGPGGVPGAAIAVPLGGFGPVQSGSGTRPQISVPPIPPASSAEIITLPLDSYEQVASQQQAALSAASDLLTQRCMQARGFSYPVAAQTGTSAAILAPIEDGADGVVSLVQAETYGYGQPPGGTASGIAGLGGTAIPAFAGELSNHSPGWTGALLGFVPGARARAPQRQGCLQLSGRELYGPVGGYNDPVPEIAGQAAQWTQSDTRILATARRWSGCMARRGFSYKTPAQAQAHGWPTTPTPTEIETAVADVRCKTATNLVNTWLTVEAAYQDALIAQNLTALARLQASFGVLLRRAENVLLIPAAGLPQPGAQPSAQARQSSASVKAPSSSYGPTTASTLG